MKIVPVREPKASLALHDNITMDVVYLSRSAKQRENDSGRRIHVVRYFCRNNNQLLSGSNQLKATKLHVVPEFAQSRSLCYRLKLTAISLARISFKTFFFH